MQDIASERAVLSSICQYGQSGLLEVSDLLSTGTFTDTNNQVLYKVFTNILAVQDKIDLASIISTANEINMVNFIEKDENIRYIRSLLNFPVRLENVRLYAKKLKKLEIARVAQTKHKLAFDELGLITGKETINEILAISEKPINELYVELNDKTDGPELIFSGAAEIIQDKIDNPNDNIGLPTPFPRFNASIGGGMRKGGVTLVVARTGNGKSIFAKDCGIHLAQLGVPVLYLDTEMVKAEQLPRILGGLSKVNTTRIETGKIGKSEIERTRVFNTIKQNENIPFYHLVVAGKDFDEILAIIRRWILKTVGYDDNGKVKNCLVIYDYFKLMSSDILKSMEEYQAMGFQISKMADFSKEFDFPVLSFVQVNRDGITKETSDIIAQSDRLLWICTSCTILKRKSAEEIAVEGDHNGNAKMIPLKARFGPGLEAGDYINMTFDGNTTSFHELSTRNEAMKKDKNTGFDVDDRHPPTESDDSN